MDSVHLCDTDAVEVLVVRNVWESLSGRLLMRTMAYLVAADDILDSHRQSEQGPGHYIVQVENDAMNSADYVLMKSANNVELVGIMNSHLCQASNLESAMTALRLVQSIADEAVAAPEAFYVETLAAFVAIEVDAHAAVEVYTVDT